MCRTYVTAVQCVNITKVKRYLFGITLALPITVKYIVIIKLDMTIGTE